jgi:hypothetical protein
VVELANAWRASMGLDPICEDSPVHEESEDEAEAAAESLDSTSGESLNTTQAESKQIRERVQLAFGDDGKVTETPLNPESDDEPPITPGNEECVNRVNHGFGGLLFVVLIAGVGRAGKC